MYIHTIYSSPILSALSSSCLVDVCWGYLENLYSLKINILTTSLQTTWKYMKLNPNATCILGNQKMTCWLILGPNRRCSTRPLAKAPIEHPSPPPLTTSPASTCPPAGHPTWDAWRLFPDLSFQLHHQLKSLYPDPTFIRQSLSALSPCNIHTHISLDHQKPFRTYVQHVLLFRNLTGTIQTSQNQQPLIVCNAQPHAAAKMQPAIFPTRSDALWRNCQCHPTGSHFSTLDHSRKRLPRSWSTQ